MDEAYEVCLYANAFVKGVTQETFRLPDPPVGLVASMDHEVHPRFGDEFKGIDGVFLTFHDGHCLCHFEEWESLIHYSESIRVHNGVDSLPVMLFWTGADYEEVIWKEMDCELDTLDEKPEEGTILNVGVSISRRLNVNLGKDVKLDFKSGKISRGRLEIYQESGDYGLLRTKEGEVHFSSRELENVESIVNE